MNLEAWARIFQICIFSASLLGVVGAIGQWVIKEKIAERDKRVAAEKDKARQIEAQQLREEADKKLEAESSARKEAEQKLVDLAMLTGAMDSRVHSAIVVVILDKEYLPQELNGLKIRCEIECMASRFHLEITPAFGAKGLFGKRLNTGPMQEPFDDLKKQMTSADQTYNYSGYEKANWIEFELQMEEKLPQKLRDAVQTYITVSVNNSFSEKVVAVQFCLNQWRVTEVNKAWCKPWRNQILLKDIEDGKDPFVPWLLNIPGLPNLEGIPISLSSERVKKRQYYRDPSLHLGIGGSPN